MKAGKTLLELVEEVTRQSKSKRDYMATTETITPVLENNSLALDLGDKGCYPVNELAHEQIGGHVDIPKRYYDRMRTEAHQLLVSNIDTWFKKHPAVRMIRTLDTKTRAFLSNSYRPLDNYDFVNSILPVLGKKKLEIMSCDVTEKRLYLKAVDTTEFKVPVGYKMGDGSHKVFDIVAPAIIISNSEVGCGRFVVETGVYTRACTNMALFAGSGMKRTHIGARHKLLEEVEDLDSIMSERTRSKTNEALWLQVHDLIASAFVKATVEKRVEMLEAAGSNKITGNIQKVIEVTAERFGLSDTEQNDVLRFLIEGGQLSQYGLHSAITRAAQESESYDRSTEMEYLGGKVVELSRNEWNTLQDA
jgi:hypothetical protein